MTRPILRTALLAAQGGPPRPPTPSLRAAVETITEADCRQRPAGVGLIDAEQAARIVRLMFFLALDVANTTAAPAWDPAARQRIVQGAGTS